MQPNTLLTSARHGFSPALRHRHNAALSLPPLKNNIIIDPNNEIVFLNNEQIELTYIEYQILYLLLSNRKHIYSTQALYENIWNEPYYYSANNTIMVHIRNLRKKIETDPQNPKVIKTIWGKGYRCD